MTNGEKYKDTIIKYIKSDSEDNINNAYCEFIKSKILSCYGLNCKGLDCHDCGVTQSLWFSEEYKEPEVDWTKIAVDTPILVRDNECEKWQKRYFAKYQDGYIYTYPDGLTSWSSDGMPLFKWKHGKLANETE